MKDTKDARRYFDMVKRVVDSGKVVSEGSKSFLKDYAETALYYALLVESGNAVAAMATAFGTSAGTWTNVTP